MKLKLKFTASCVPVPVTRPRSRVILEQNGLQEGYYLQYGNAMRAKRSLDEKLNHSNVDNDNNVSIDANDCVYVHDYEESPDDDEEAVHLAGLEETYTEPLLTNPVDCSDLKEVSYETQDTSYESYETEEDVDEETFERHQ
eukprot:scaffold159999_cov36-Cyclotella_meneghiniana.AAC.1